MDRRLAALVAVLGSLVAVSHAATHSLKDIDHVVLFMQENRAFDHYFGTMAGVRGFADPNVHIASDGLPVWFQQVTPAISNATKELLPWYINAAGGTTPESSQCMTAGSNGFQANHLAFANGENNQWATQNTPFSWGHYKRADLPQHFGIAEGWTMADMYSQSVLASTDPNRAFWASGSVNVPGGPQQLGQGGVTLDNNETPGCEGTDLNCFPLGWKTYAEFLEDAGVSWQVVYVDNFDDNPYVKRPHLVPGLSFIGFEAFYDAAAKGTLPAVSYLIGPAELSEHPPFSPLDGGWLQQQVVNAVTNSPKYANTVLIISYDESGGWGDHVIPITAPPNTPGEWLTNPFNTSTTTFAGPGYRLPFYVISPFTRGGHVFVEHSDHSSQIMFMEEWLAAKGMNVKTDQLNGWRRDHMSNLLKMFDFNHPDFSIPHIPAATPPAQNSAGQFTGTATCVAKFPNPQPAVPFGKQTLADSLTIEDGFKVDVGLSDPTEGRFLVFESSGVALAANKESLATTPARAQHNDPNQRFIIHALADPPSNIFTIQFASPSFKTATFLSPHLNTAPASQAGLFAITDLGNGAGYTIQETSSKEFLSVARGGKVTLSKSASAFQAFSVTMGTDVFSN
ncbi:non-hemolytic phospholipase C precursor [Sistotremastrum suecicum HHB10207 ss-3]|uniref:Non-hemolytic phospholipase C n=1 Tax=Sistotremastrum suecicum HHB10207 ss-3 TaxID=1314776 RepID=A0A166AKD7_9AGAM|nr:non-hemolytic phospholipase C precursor [Sistotremastrum suecicum HHB10207 ss-3]